MELSYSLNTRFHGTFSIAWYNRQTSVAHSPQELFQHLARVGRLLLRLFVCL